MFPYEPNSIKYTFRTFQWVNAHYLVWNVYGVFFVDVWVTMVRLGVEFKNDIIFDFRSSGDSELGTWYHITK